LSALSSEELVTVVIPARNEEGAIAASLRSVLAQDWPSLQVIVVDGASTDSTARLVAAMAHQDRRVEVMGNPVGIIPVSLNLALAQARGAWFVRVDAHAEIPPWYVRTVVGHLGSGLWGGVGGRKNAIGTTPAGRAVAAAMSSKFGVGNSTYHYGNRVQPVEHIPFGAYPTELIRRLGGWDEDLVVNQDFEFDFRLRQAGYQLLFDPDLTIDWQCQQSIPDLYRQYRRYGKGKARVARLHLRSIRLRHLAAPALTASWVAAGLLALKRPGSALISLLPYSGAVIAASALAAPPLVSWRERQWLPAAFVAMHAGWGIGFWEGVTQLAAEALRLKGPSRPRARPGTSVRSTACP
jgi:cellulose synthase/poly-beta-1,6-N-acetylglucosamine synthase-like glycosyltransferase